MKSNEELEIEREIPRFASVILGLILFPISIVSVVGSAVIVFDPQIKNFALTCGLGGIFLLFSIAAFFWSFKLIFGIKQKRGGLLSPVLLRCSSLILLIIPISSIYTGTFMQAPVTRGIQTICYFLGFIALNKLASIRSKKKENT